MKLSKEREAEIRAIGAWTSLQVENPLKVRDELLAEIDRLRGEQKKDLLLHKESVAHLEGAVELAKHFEKVLKKNHGLKQLVSLLNSMILAGESHSDQSRLMMREALSNED